MTADCAPVGSLVSEMSRAVSEHDLVVGIRPTQKLCSLSLLAVERSHVIAILTVLMLAGGLRQILRLHLVIRAPPSHLHRTVIQTRRAAATATANMGSNATSHPKALLHCGKSLDRMHERFGALVGCAKRAQRIRYAFYRASDARLSTRFDCAGVPAPETAACAWRRMRPVFRRLRLADKRLVDKPEGRQLMQPVM